MPLTILDQCTRTQMIVFPFLRNLGFYTLLTEIQQRPGQMGLLFSVSAHHRICCGPTRTACLVIITSRWRVSFASLPATATAPSCEPIGANTEKLMGFLRLVPGDGRRSRAALVRRTHRCRGSSIIVSSHAANGERARGGRRGGGRRMRGKEGGGRPLWGTRCFSNSRLISYSGSFPISSRNKCCFYCSEVTFFFLKQKFAPWWMGKAAYGCYINNTFYAYFSPFFGSWLWNQTWERYISTKGNLHSIILHIIVVTPLPSV